MAHAETFQSYTKFVRSTMMPGDSDTQLKHFIMGLIGELGEVSEPFKKHLFRGEPLNTAKLLYEVGDVVWYVFAIADLMGVKLDRHVTTGEDAINFFIRKGEEHEPSTVTELIMHLSSLIGDLACTYLENEMVQDIADYILPNLSLIHISEPTRH